MGGEPKEYRSRRRVFLPWTFKGRQTCILVLFCLAVLFSLRAWRVATILPGQLGEGDPWSPNDALKPGKDSDQCQWRPNGPLLYNLEHSNLHADASHWFHVAECYIGRRSDFKEFHEGMAGADVYVQDWDSTWSAKLTPMTRLLVVAGLTSVGVSAVHFIDGNHASFTTPSQLKDGAAGGVRGAGGGGGGGGVGSPPGSGTPRPRRGQVGVLRLNDYAHRNQFVVSSRQSLPDMLVSTDEVAPLRPGGAWDERGGGDVGVGGGKEGGSGSGRGGGGGGGGTECVKFVAHVGSWGRQRNNWFKEERDPRDFLLAIDNFCPIPWLRKEEEEEEEGAGAMEDDGDEDIGQREVEVAEGAAAAAGGRALGGVFVGGRGGGGGGGGLHAGRGFGGGRGFAGGLKQFEPEEHRKVVIYQRDRNRQLLKTEELVNELRDRLGYIGWTVELIVHDVDRHPCDLISQISEADVLLTPHGFQSMLSVFMRPGSILFEVYPHKYFKTGYSPIAEKMGLRYGFSESRPILPLTGSARPTMETCMQWYLCRWYVRRSDVEISEESLEVLISFMLQHNRAR